MIMKNQKIAILGAGISGLSFAYYLKKFNPTVDFTIYEESDQAGGMVYSEEKDGCVLEWGPRGIRPKGKGQCVLELVEDLGLWDDLVFADDSAKKRYLYHDDKLQVLPHSIRSFLVSPYFILFAKAIFRDLRASNYNGDETISSFVDRHFGFEFRSLFFDSMVSGIWAGDVTKMSISATLPLLKRLEGQSGSILRALIGFKSDEVDCKKYPQNITSKALFSFKGGVQQLVDSLKVELSQNIVYNARIEDLEVSDSVKFNVSGESHSFSRIVSTIPAHKLCLYLEGDLCDLLESINYSPVALQNVRMKKSEFNFDGFGFLVPSKEGSVVLGMVANNNTFPEHSTGEFVVNTIMMGGARFTAKRLKAMNLEVESSVFLNKVFGDNLFIGSSELKIIEKAIPQYELGHLDRVLKIVELSPAAFTILGNYMYGVSLIDIISKSKEVAKEYLT